MNSITRRSVRISCTRSAVSWLRVLLIGCALLLQIGCSTYSGIAEFSSYRDAWSRASDIGEDILDRLAVAERGIHGRAYPFIPRRDKFALRDVAYIVPATDPPATAAYRRLLRSIRSYNEALYGLASGQEAAAIVGRVNRLAAIGASATAEVALIVGAGPTSGAAGAAAATLGVNQALAGLEPLATQLVAFETRRQFRQRLLDQEPHIRRAIVEARDSTPRVFELLRGDIVGRANADPNRTRLTAAEEDEIRRLRILLANWVVLLDASRGALEVATAAVRDAPGAGGFDGLLVSGEQLTAAAQAARLSLAGGN